jgi:hypothetical protein
MIYNLYHLIVAFAFFITIFLIDHHKIWLFSRVLFWKRRDDLLGSYEATWIIKYPIGKLPIDRKIQELIRIEWASGSFVTGTATSPKYGDYSFQGRIEGSAITLNYSSHEKKLKEYLGVAMLKIDKRNTLSGYWIQNKPDLSVVLVGSVIWKKRVK